MKETIDDKNKNTIGNKLKRIFAIFVIFVMMTAVTVVFLGIEVPTQQQQSSQEKKQQISDIESPIPKLVGLAEELENQGSSFLEKTKTTTTDESQREQQKSNYFSELNCDELSDIASSFEDGWSKALAEYSSRCDDMQK